MCLFYYCLDLTIANCLVLHRLSESGRIQIRQHVFRKRLVSELLKEADAMDGTARRDTVEAVDAAGVPAAAKRRRWYRGDGDEGATSSSHAGVMQWLPGTPQLSCDACYRKRSVKNRANVVCLVCELRFCHNRRRDCFGEAHTAKGCTFPHVATGV